VVQASIIVHPFLCDWCYVLLLKHEIHKLPYHINVLFRLIRLLK